MTQQRSNDETRADIAVMDASAMWSDRYHDALIRVLRDIEPLLARAERAEAQVRAVEALPDAWDKESSEWYYENRHERGTEYACGFEDGWGHAAGLLRAALAAAAIAGLSLQEEQPTHLVGAGGWRACDTAADWAGSDTTGVTCAECLATTTDVLQEEQE